MAVEKRVETHIERETFAPVHGERIPVAPHADHAAAYRTAEPAAAIKRISWAAIFAGVVIVLVTQLLLSILGLGVGASTINPATEQNPASGLATPAGIWFVVSSLCLRAAGWRADWRAFRAAPTAFCTGF